MLVIQAMLEQTAMVELLVILAHKETAAIQEIMALLVMAEQQVMLEILVIQEIQALEAAAVAPVVAAVEQT